MDATSIELSCASALGYLARHQHASGYWLEYELPVGMSDAWVTALVGFSCAELATSFSGATGAMAGRLAHEASDWLENERAYDVGWGFNGRTGPDADSTAWALRLLGALRRPLRPSDVQFLLEHWIEGSGFATYRRKDAWGNAHADVTANVALALPAPLRDLRRASIADAVMSSRQANGAWPAYWWRTWHYSAAINLELLATWRMLQPHPLCVDTSETGSLHSTFDVACALLASCFVEGCGGVASVLADAIVSRQTAAGNWTGGDDLRVTDSNCYEPWLVAAGARYSETRHLVTTAVVLRALLRYSKSAP
jgi:hypothetical protein